MLTSPDLPGALAKGQEDGLGNSLLIPRRSNLNEELATG